MLTLPIKKKWFDMIISGEKKEEYRDFSKYYIPRLGKYCDGKEYEVILRNGYKSTSPSIKCKITCDLSYGKPSWGAEIGVEYYVLKILSVEVIQSD